MVDEGQCSGYAAVIAAAPITTLIPRLRAGAAEVLHALGVSSLEVDQEVAKMARAAVGRTANRQATGILVDFAKGLDVYLEHEPSLLACSLKLAETPCSPLYKTTISPDRETLKLFPGKH